MTTNFQLERLKLKLAINKYLRKWSKQYAVTLKQQLRCDTPELFNELVDELAAEGMLVKETGATAASFLWESQWEIQPVALSELQPRKQSMHHDPPDFKLPTETSRAGLAPEARPLLQRSRFSR